MIPTENLTWIIAAAVAAVVIVVVATVIVVRRRRAIASRRRDELEAGAPTTEAPEREADETGWFEVDQVAEEMEAIIAEALAAVKREEEAL